MQQHRKLSPSIKVVPLANGMMPDEALKTIFPWFGIKHTKKRLPDPDEVENCLRLVPVKLQVRDILRERIDDFLASVDFLEVQICNTTTTLMVPSSVDGDSESNKRLVKIWQETFDGILSAISKMSELSEEAANEMGQQLLSQFVAANLDITVTAWDLRTWLESEFEDDFFDPDDDIFDEDSTSEPSVFAKLLLQAIQKAWPWLVEDIDYDFDDYFGETIH